MIVLFLNIDLIIFLCSHLPIYIFLEKKYQNNIFFLTLFRDIFILFYYKLILIIFGISVSWLQIFIILRFIITNYKI